MVDDFKHLLPLEIFHVIDRAGINTPKQIMILSCWEIKKATNLRIDDIQLLKNVVSECEHSKSLTCYDLLQQECISRVTTGCKAIDSILNGGFRKGTITEVYGESGSGKTQIALQSSAHTWPDCAVYICTEDLFPIKRFNEIRKSMPHYNPEIDYGSTTFVEHITEAKDLLSCVSVRLPKLLAQKKFSLVVIDSVAAPFRVESTNYVQRAEEMRELAMSLLTLGQKFNLAILCINQVTAAFNSTNDMLPALGLAWSNMVSTRLYLKKTSKTVNLKCKETGIECTSQVREVSVCFSSDLPNTKAEFAVTLEGLQGF